MRQFKARLSICSTRKMPEKPTQLNKRLLIALVVVLAVVIVAVALGVHFGGKKDDEDEEVPDTRVQECVGKLVQQKDCSGIAELLKIENKLADKNERCACYDLARNELFPECLESQNLTQQCSNKTAAVWTELVAFYKRQQGGTESTLDQCEGYQVNPCDATTITVPYRCYTLYESEGGCRVMRCINATEQVPEGCSVAEVNTTAVQQRTEALYGSTLYCASLDLQRCGVGIFPLASVTLCPRPWNAWKRLTEEAQKCSAYEGFLICTAYEMVVSGVDYCGFQTLHQNILADTSNNGDNPNVCGDAAAKFSDMDRKFPTSRTDVCDNAFFHYTTFKFHCVASPILFNGTSDREKCMSEMARKNCMLDFLGEAKLSCTDETIRATSADPEVRNGIFELAPGCEDSYPCVVQTLQQNTDARFHQSCVQGLVQFLRLASMGINVSEALAKDSDTDKMKCRVWNVFSACALQFTPASCQTSVADVQSGLQILVHALTASSEDVPVKVNTFDECPGYSHSVNECPVNDQLLYSTLAYCGFTAMNLPEAQTNATVICESLTDCASGMRASYPNCAEIDTYFEAFLAVNTTDYIETVLGVDCKQTG